MVGDGETTTLRDHCRRQGALGTTLYVRMQFNFQFWLLPHPSEAITKPGCSHSHKCVRPDEVESTELYWGQTKAVIYSWHIFNCRLANDERIYSALCFQRLWLLTQVFVSFRTALEILIIVFLKLEIRLITNRIIIWCRLLVRARIPTPEDCEKSRTQTRKPSAKMLLLF